MPDEKRPKKLTRPTILNEEIYTKIQNYLDGDYFTVPTVKGLCLYLGITRSTLYEWKKTNQKITDMLEELLQTEHTHLIANGLNNKWNSNIVKLMLSKLGYSPVELMKGQDDVQSLEKQEEHNQPKNIELVVKL